MIAHGVRQFDLDSDAVAFGTLANQINLTLPTFRAEVADASVSGVGIDPQ